MSRRRDGSREQQSKSVLARARQLFEEQRDQVIGRTSRMFAWLLLIQWLAAIGVALWLSPYTWDGKQQVIHVHVYAAIILGGLLSAAPVGLCLLQPTSVLTRHMVAVAQMLWSALLIHLSGGRIETHFHVFGSLTFLAFYRDWRVLLPATLVVAADHFLRGILWPESVYGIVNPEWWRFLEHGFWVAFLDTFLFIATFWSVREMRAVADRQAQIEALSQRLADQRTLLACQSEASVEGIVLFSNQDQLLAHNRRFLDMWGISEAADGRLERADLRRAALDLVEDPQAFFRRLEELDREIDTQVTDEIVLKDGRVYERFVAPLRTESGAIIGRGFFFHDVSEARRGERAVREMNTELERRVHERTLALEVANADLESSLVELRQIQQKLLLSDRLAAVGRLSAGIAHEINNPLAYMSANLDFLEEQVPGLAEEPCRPLDERTALVDEIRLALQEAKHGGERVRRIVDDLRMFARSDEEHRQELDIADVVETSVKMVANEVRHRARLIREVGATPRIHADRGRLGQVFLNLLVNAAQALPDGRPDENEIRIRTYTDELGRAVVEIRDTGTGIPPEIRNRLFDPFFTTKPIGVGTGLGLSICHGIVTALGGEISVESEVGRGSTFRTAIPPGTPVAVAPPSPPAPVQHLDSAARILVIDDDPMVLSSLRRILDGHDVTLTRTGIEALQLIEKRDFDIILCDLMMPEMTGMDFYANLEVVAPHQRERVLFMTGGTFTEQARSFLEGLAGTWLEKPFSARRVREAIAGTYMRSPARGRANLAAPSDSSRLSTHRTA